MKTSDLWARVTRKGANPEKTAEQVLERPAMLPQLFDGLDADSPDIQSACAKVLRQVSIKGPDLLYPHVDLFILLLDSPHGSLKWEAIRTVANLAKVDERGRIDQILEEYLEHIRGPVMVTGTTTMEAAAIIAQAKPALATTIARAILKVQWADYESEECRNTAFVQAIEALDRLFDMVENRAEILEFVRGQSENPRNATRKKAAQFLGKHPRP